ncbi:hypothetical protein [Streptomyces sp. NPDC002845]
MSEAPAGEWLRWAWAAPMRRSTGAARARPGVALAPRARPWSRRLRSVPHSAGQGGPPAGALARERTIPRAFVGRGHRLGLEHVGPDRAPQRDRRPPLPCTRPARAAREARQPGFFCGA